MNEHLNPSDEIDLICERCSEEVAYRLGCAACGAMICERCAVPPPDFNPEDEDDEPDELICEVCF